MRATKHFATWRITKFGHWPHIFKNENGNWFFEFSLFHQNFNVSKFNKGER